MVGADRILAAVELTRTTDAVPLDLARLAAVTELLRGGDIAVLSGAGISTESGIPDYRGPDGKRRVAPMTYGEFVASADNRRRYWARSFVGWRRFAAAAPNDGHRAVAALQRLGLVSEVITQNVDGLHQAAGARDVLELHGSLDRVVCLNCGESTARADVDTRLREANPGFEVVAGEIRPDGDVVLPEEAVRGFHPPRCLVCASDLVKPDVVFFGENVPRERVDRCYALVEDASALLVLGSSLTVMSGLRFVRRAADLGVPVAIVNQGATRGDDLATLRLDGCLGSVLPELVTTTARAAAPG